MIFKLINVKNNCSLNRDCINLPILHYQLYYLTKSSHKSMYIR